MHMHAVRVAEGCAPLPGETQELSESGILWTLNCSHGLSIQGQVCEIPALEDASTAVPSPTPDQHQLCFEMEALALARAEPPGLPAAQIVFVHRCIRARVDGPRQISAMALHMHAKVRGTTEFKHAAWPTTWYIYDANALGGGFRTVTVQTWLRCGRP